MNDVYSTIAIFVMVKPALIEAQLQAIARAKETADLDDVVKIVLRSWAKQTRTSHKLHNKHSVWRGTQDKGYLAAALVAWRRWTIQTRRRAGEQEAKEATAEASRSEYTPMHKWKAITSQNSPFLTRDCPSKVARCRHSDGNRNRC